MKSKTQSMLTNCKQICKNFTRGGLLNSKKNKLFLLFIILLVIVGIFSITNVTKKSYALSNTLYDQVETDITVNGYGSTYTGDHADKVDSSGNEVVGNENIYYYTSVGYNHVKLGNFCWKIIRTTDTGGVKLIYTGEYEDNNVKCGRPGAINLSSFNSSTNNAKYVGYKYKTTNWNDTDSTIKTYIDNWYQNNMTSFSSKLEDIVFCNDRSGSNYSYNATSGEDWYGEGTTDFYFHYYDKNYKKLTCLNAKDRFAVINNEAKLTYPIGLMNAVERNLIGDDLAKINNSSGYWLMTPVYYSSSYQKVSAVNNSGYYTSNNVNTSYSINPVISLKPNITFNGGSGSEDDPYVVGDIVEPTEFTVTYNANSNGTFSGTTSETVAKNGNPTGRNVTPNSGYKFGGWKANKMVTLKDNSTISKGTVMTNNQVKDIVVKNNIVLTASYFKNYLYNQVEEDVNENDYGKVYKGSHADTVENDGTNIIGSENIYYYDVSDHNNVKFGNFCWQVIRTTDTGGVKLLYNGSYSDTNKCNNSGTNKQIGTSKFNESKSTAISGGYKYKNSSWNDTDSTIKKYIDNWYNNNISNYRMLLENIVYCNDRTGSNSNYFAKSGMDWYPQGTNNFYYHNHGSSYDYSNLKCYSAYDSFAVNNTLAKLDYPIGLITTPEYALGGKSGNNIFWGGKYFWHISPSSMDDDGICVNSSGGGCNTTDLYEGVRPVISLVPNITYSSGAGSVSDPYIIGDVVEPTEFKVTYDAGSNGTISGTTSEIVAKNGNPTGRTITPKNGYEFIGWKANRKVTLKNNESISKGTVMTSNQVKDIVVKNRIALTASYFKEWLYNQVEEDIKNKGYGETYTGEHVDAVSSSGNEIIGTKNIYYYKSEAIYNHVKIGDYCWKIIRTTDTGGVKLLYNGLYDSTDKCNTMYAGEPNNEITIDGTYYYGTTYIHYSGSSGFYKISGLTSSANPDTLSDVLEYGRRFTCLKTSSSDACDTMYYINSYDSSTHKANVIKYTKTTRITYLDSVMYNSLYNNAKYLGYKYKTTSDNDTDSTIKAFVDDWYQYNFKEYSNILEDPVFCNDRTGSTSYNAYQTGTEWYAEGTNSFYYHNNSDSSNYGSLACYNAKDRFTTNNSVAKLKYPIGLITVPEYLFGYDNYKGINTNKDGTYSYWTISPSGYNAGARIKITYGASDVNSSSDVSSYKNIVTKPVVSLAPNIAYEGGKGTVMDPYVISGVVEPSITATIYYQKTSDGSTTVDTKEVSCTPGSNGSCSVTIPNEVRSSVGRYNTSYAGLASNYGTMSTVAGKTATTVTISEDTNFYSVYSTPVTNYYYSS